MDRDEMLAALGGVAEELLSMARSHRSVIPPAELMAVVCTDMAKRVGAVRDSIAGVKAEDAKAAASVTYVVYKDGEPVSAPLSEWWPWLMKHQGNSIAYAFEFGGYAVRDSDGNWYDYGTMAWKATK